MVFVPYGKIPQETLKAVFFPYDRNALCIFGVPVDTGQTLVLDKVLDVRGRAGRRVLAENLSSSQTNRTILPCSGIE
jgi:hypothetical protein